MTFDHLLRNADTKYVVGVVDGLSPSSGWYYCFVFLIQLLVRSSSLLIVLQRKVVERVEVPFRVDFQMDQRTLDRYFVNHNK